MSRFVRMFKPRFAPLVKSGAKRQTIRPWPKRVPRIGDIIDCRKWKRLPYRSKQVKLKEAPITGLCGVIIDRHLVMVGHAAKTYRPLGEFAKADGFKNWPDMRKWFEAEHGLPFRGLLIVWK